MKTFVYTQFGIALLFSVAALIDSMHLAISVGLGAAVMILDFALMAWTWSMIGRKKLIALSLLIIVSKYTILAVLLYKIMSLSWIKPVGFLIGISLFVLATVVWTLFFRNSEDSLESVEPTTTAQASLT